jgi:hypothetical protein
MKRMISCGLLLGLATISGCGTPFESDVDSYPTLATVRGQLNKDMSFEAPAANVRVAVLWMSVTNGYKQAIDLPVQPVFPADFKIDLTQAPPLEMFDAVNDAPAFKLAHGALVAYEDVNQNGRLDLVDGSSPAFVDRILGANGNLVLTYIDGTMPVTPALRDTTMRLPPSLGYNLLSVSCSVTGSAPGSCDETWEWKTMSDLYQLTLSSDPHLAPIMCLTRTASGICAY